MKLKLGVGLFCIVSFLLGGCQQKVKVEEKIVPKTYICHQTTGKIKVDGLLDEQDWQKAKAIRFYHLKRKGLQDYQEAESSAIGKLLWDKDNLYIGIEAKDKDIWATMGDEEILCSEDVLEVFLKPDRNKPTYYEFELSPKNALWDLMWPRRGARSSKAASLFESHLNSAVKVYGTLNNWHDIDNKWVLEVAIPFSAFKEATSSPKIGDEWSFALCRYDYSVYLEEGRELSSTAKLSKLNFHLWEDYDQLLFQN